jgi:hypothetical protein
MTAESGRKSNGRVQEEQPTIMRALAIVWTAVWTQIIPALGIALAVACISLCRSLRHWNKPA